MGLDNHFPGNFEDSGTPSPSSFRLSADNINNLWSRTGIYLNDLKMLATFVRELQQATLGDPTQGLSCKRLECLCNPLHKQPSASVDKDSWLAIDLYLGTLSEATYKTMHMAILCRWPGTELPSYYKAKHLVTDLSSIESIVYDMCINSYVAYTGPFLELESCPICSEH